MSSQCAQPFEKNELHAVYESTVGCERVNWSVDFSSPHVSTPATTTTTQHLINSNNGNDDKIIKMKKDELEKKKKRKNVVKYV